MARSRCSTLTCVGTGPEIALPRARGGRGLHPPVAGEGVTAELLDIRDEAIRVVAVIGSPVASKGERRPEPHGELITVRDGKVCTTT